MKYFEGLTKVEDVKTLFRRLAMKHHPDRGGDTATFQEIQAQYQSALRACNGSTSTGSDGKEHTYKYNEESEIDLMDKINTFLALNMENVNIMLIGVWIWIDGDTKPHKDKLKELGCKWHGRRKCWYFHNQKKRFGKYSKGSLDELAAKYGQKGFTRKSAKLS